MQAVLESLQYGLHGMLTMNGANSVSLLVEELTCKEAVPFCLPLLGSRLMSLLPPEAFFFSYAVSKHCGVFSFPIILLTTAL